MTPSREKNAIQKICDSLLNDSDLIDPAGIKTFCNVFVYRVCNQFGYKKLNYLIANQIHDFLTASPEWREISNGEACDRVNDGFLIIASHPGIPHGHVGIVYGGFNVFSGKWDCYVPRVADVSEKASIRGVNYAFKVMPKFHILMGMDRQEVMA